MKIRMVLAVLGTTLFAWTAPVAAVDHPFQRTEERADCAQYHPLRAPFFGDLHVHTTFSFDAWAQGTLNTPRDAYRFAQGQPVGIQPYQPDGNPERTVQLRRPLDFAMVSDHAEMLGETELCRTEGSPAYGSYACVLLRRWPKLGYMIVNSQWGLGKRSVDICSHDGHRCHDAAISPWKAIRDAAEEFYDRSSECRFTTFVGFEWSGTRVGMVHRNVVFRNEHVPDFPPDATDDHNDETVLWSRLEEECLQTDSGCDALAIPHNSNVSEGSMFWTVAPDGSPLTQEMARRRSKLEPLIEITQHKGDSECRNDGVDPLCDFETLAFGNIAGHASSLYATPVPPRVYVREGLLEGLHQQQELGANPFKLGIIGSTDTHLGTPGLVDEDMFVGHAAGIVTARLEIPVFPDSPVFNPGGLAVLWAEENSRDSLFEAMQRREAYGTSGTRPIVRFFGGWDYEDDLCGSPELVARGYAGGVPMGGDLPPMPSSASGPTFVARALKDPGTADHPGTQLQRIQIIKGWLENGQQVTRVINVAGDPHNGAGVDLDTCKTTGSGADQLCTVWRDDDFDPSTPAFYYVRVVENPTCRWSQYSCLAAKVDCDAMFGPNGPLAACCDPAVPKTIQERAWTSPIWYTPPSGAVGKVRNGSSRRRQNMAAPHCERENPSTLNANTVRAEEAPLPRGRLEACPERRRRAPFAAFPITQSAGVAATQSPLRER